MLLAIQGRPDAIASINATGSPSLYDGKAYTSAQFNNSAISVLYPNKCKFTFNALARLIK